MRIFKFAAAMLLVVAAFTASAAQPATPLQTDAIRGEQAQIKDGIDARTGAYKDLPATTREQLLTITSIASIAVNSSAFCDESSSAVVCLPSIKRSTITCWASNCSRVLAGKSL